ncbi:MAG: hypothetical protein IPG94_22210 [Kineosporiaceae bacterium]|nr:hypothetical protein [Kineosporiaceae bacterium]
MNPAILFAEHGLQVAATAEPFPEAAYARGLGQRFPGYGGTNAHVVLVAGDRDDAAPSTYALLQRDRSPMARVFPLSGRNEAG